MSTFVWQPDLMLVQTVVWDVGEAHRCCSSRQRSPGSCRHLTCHNTQPVNRSQDGQPTCRDCERWILWLWHRWSSLGKSANIRMNSQIGLIISVVRGNGKSLDRIFSLQYYIVITVSTESVVDLHKWPGFGGWRLLRVGGRWARGSRTCRSEAPPARWPGRRCAPSDRTSSTASPWDSRATSRPSDTWHTAAKSYKHRM